MPSWKGVLSDNNSYLAGRHSVRSKQTNACDALISTMPGTQKCLVDDDDDDDDDPKNTINFHIEDSDSRIIK